MQNKLFFKFVLYDLLSFYTNNFKVFPPLLQLQFPTATAATTEKGISRFVPVTVNGFMKAAPCHV